MTEPPIKTAGRQIWRCDGCGQRSIWTDEHRIYGSIRQEDERAWSRMIVTCSAACREATEAAGRARHLSEPVVVATETRFGAPASVR